MPLSKRAAAIMEQSVYGGGEMKASYDSLKPTLPVKKPAPLKSHSTPKRSWFERWFRGLS